MSTEVRRGLFEIDHAGRRRALDGFREAAGT
jgi:hypothetical protein